MTQTCKYCKTNVFWDTKIEDSRKWREKDGTLHTFDRCKEIQGKKTPLETKLKKSEEDIFSKMNVQVSPKVDEDINLWDKLIRTSHIKAYKFHEDDFTEQDTRIATAGLSQNFALFHSNMEVARALKELAEQIKNK